jgi:hypothetical protein
MPIGKKYLVTKEVVNFRTPQKHNSTGKEF